MTSTGSRISKGPPMTTPQHTQTPITWPDLIEMASNYREKARLLKIVNSHAALVAALNRLHDLIAWKVENGYMKRDEEVDSVLEDARTVLREAVGGA